MIEFLGEEYYINFDGLNDFLMSDESLFAGTTTNKETTIMFNEKDKVVGRTVITTEMAKPREVNIVKYDIIRGFIDDLGATDEEDDSAMGAHNLEKMGPRFKLAFNTLKYYDILRHK